MILNLIFFVLVENGTLHLISEYKTIPYFKEEVATLEVDPAESRAIAAYIPQDP